MTDEADVAYVRLLIADLDADLDARLFLDDQLALFLERERDVHMAAAQALDTIATSEALISKKIRTQDLSTDGPAVAAELRARADELRNQADLSAFDIVDFDPGL